MNRCQCKAGYAEGECKKHGLPIIFTITDDAYCPACRISQIQSQNNCKDCGDHLLEMAKLTKEILKKEAVIEGLTESLGQMTDMAMKGNVK